MTADQYRSLAADYHWFFGDADLFLGCDTPGVRATMARLEPGARVIDVACGIGVDAAALARRGFDVSASDASEEMAAVARRRLDELGVGPDRIVTTEWANLPAHFRPESFDAVYCVGNSLAHAPDATAMLLAFEAFRTLLVPGGVLVVDSLDWEIVHAGGSHTEVEPGILERDGLRCVRTYSWHIPDEFGAPCLLEIAPIFLDGDRVSLRSYPVRMWPFTRGELKCRLADAGFESIALDVIPGDDRYTAIARRPMTA